MTGGKANADLRLGTLVVVVLGMGIFFAGCFVLIAVLNGYRRPLRSLGISISPELGFLLVGSGAIIAFLASKPVRNAMEPKQTCSVCDEEIPEGATTCEHCGEQLATSDLKPTEPRPAMDDEAG